ncbi:unnamed protein product [Amaranthus hypochondriacus]
MDLLVKTGAVRLRSHLDKFLVGDEDNETVRQSRNGSSKRAIWIVEATPKNPDTLRLKNYNSGLYLTASDSPFLLGMTGKRVLQLSIFDPNRVEWEPISDGFQLKFRSRIEGKYLRANGGTPPWRNSVTYDTPLTGASKTWTMWDVEPVTDLDLDHASSIRLLSPLSSFTSLYSDDSLPASPLSLISSATANHSFTRKVTYFLSFFSDCITNC